MNIFFHDIYRDNLYYLNSNNILNIEKSNTRGKNELGDIISFIEEISGRILNAKKRLNYMYLEKKDRTASKNRENRFLVVNKFCSENVTCRSRSHTFALYFSSYL